MKKLFILSAMLIAGLTSSFAQDYSARAFIKMDGQQLKLRERADYNATPEFTNGPCVSDNNNAGMAAYVSGTRYIQWGCNDLEGLTLAFVPAAAECQLTFSNVIGDLYLVDALTGVRTHIVDGEGLTFQVEAAQVGQNVADRFSISKIGEVEPQICHEGQLLKVTNYNGIVKVDDDEYQVAGNLDIDIANLSAGHHTVNFDGQDLIINVR